MWPIWKTRTAQTSILDPQVIHDICVAEQTTLSNLQAAGLCYGCNDDRCLPPFSIVFFAHLAVGDLSFSLDCHELQQAWIPVKDQVQSQLETCVQAIDVQYDKLNGALEESCPFGFSPTMVDEFFGIGNETVIRYSSSVFATSENTDATYQQVPQYDRALWSNVVTGTYDTKGEDFVWLQIDEILGRDVMLAMGSAALTTVAMIVHTRSFWLAMVGLIQIILSFPLAFFVYKLMAQLAFFPFLNFIGIFIVFALGADDVFVAVDKWKNARLEHPTANVEEIAAMALPDAARSMFLTSITTAIAFFATAVCPVAPLKCFAIFCGLLVVFDYLLCCFLVFPALCIYDKWLENGVKNCLVSCHFCSRTEAHGNEEQQQSLIRRVLLKFYNWIHCARWPLLLICIAALVLCILKSSTLDLPESSDVRMISEKDSQHEQNFNWRKNLLSEVLEKQAGGYGFVMWGVSPADTGDHKNPGMSCVLIC